MSPEIIAILIAATLQVAGLVILGWILYRMRDQMIANDAALFLQRRRISEVVHEMRDSLRR